MTEISFTVKDEVARRWERVLRQEFAGNVGEKIKTVAFDDLVKMAVFSFMADIAQRDADLALKALEESLTDDH